MITNIYTRSSRLSHLGGAGGGWAFLLLLITLPLWAEPERGLSVSILGDSYSTFEGCLATDSNEVWYYPVDSPKHHKGNDVGEASQCWWSIVIKEMGAKLERNNSFSGSTICRSGYAKDKTGDRVPLKGYEQMCDYTNRSFISRSNALGNPDIILICGGTNDSWCGAPIGDYVYGNWTDLQLYTFRPAMAKLLADLRQHYGVECLDLQDIDKQRGHPSQKGMKAIAEQVLERLKQQ